MYDHTGALYAKYSYDVWGNPVSVTNASGVEITDANNIANIQPLRYRSYYYDSDTGFYYLQSRYYDPVTHRFINADGLVSTGTGVLGYNMFAYCENNPVIFSDHDGYMIFFSWLRRTITRVIQNVRRVVKRVIQKQIKYDRKQMSISKQKYNSNTIHFSDSEYNKDPQKLNVTFYRESQLIHIDNSYNIRSKHDKLAIISEIKKSQYYDANNYASNTSTMLKEWSGHNFVYHTASQSNKMNYFYQRLGYETPIESTQGVDFRYNLGLRATIEYNFITLGGIIQW